MNDAHRIPASDHGLTRDQIQSKALEVADTLIEAGYEALLVGGCVRDLLLGTQPKDFDVATSATPEQVKELFRRSRLVGRRFRIAHVRFGREVIEVSTFRKAPVDGEDDMDDIDLEDAFDGQPRDDLEDFDEPLDDDLDAEAEAEIDAEAEPEAEAEAEAEADDYELQPPEEPSSGRRRRRKPDTNTDQRHDEHGVLVRDNRFGTLEEDAFRRDLTINALYFDPQTEEVVDYVGGMAHLKEQRIALIGEPKVRLTEDPVRLLRIIRFQAKLDFTIDDVISAVIPDVQDLLQLAAPARLFDEVNKMFLTGRALRTWQILCELDVATTLFPCVPDQSSLIDAAMANTDDRVNEGKPVTPGYLFAVMLWPDFLARCYELSGLDKPLEFSQRAADETLALQQHVIAIPRRFSQFVRETWLLQQRLMMPRPKSVSGLVAHPRFRAAYDFLLLRAATEADHLQERADWWTTYQEVDEETQDTMRSELSTEIQAEGRSSQGGGERSNSRGGTGGGGRGRQRRGSSGGGSGNSSNSGGRGRRSRSGSGSGSGTGSGNSASGKSGNRSGNRGGNQSADGGTGGNRQGQGGEGGKRRRRRRKKKAE